MCILRTPFENPDPRPSESGLPAGGGGGPVFTAQPGERAEGLAGLAKTLLAALQTLEASSGAESACAVAAARAGLVEGWTAARSVAEGFLQAAQRASEQAEAALCVLDARLAQAEAGEREAAAAVAQAANHLAELGRQERCAAESTNLDGKRTVLEELRTAMEKRDHTAAEASRLANEETQLLEEIKAAVQEKEALLAEAEAQAAVVESARAHWEVQQQAPSSPAIEEARRNLNAAKTATDTAFREARVATDALARLEERLAAVRKRRGEMRWQQAADHESFEKRARTLRIFTPEALRDAFAELECARVAQQTPATRAAESKRLAAEKALFTAQGFVAELRAKRIGRQSALTTLGQLREVLSREVAGFVALGEALTRADCLAQIPGGLAVVARVQSQWMALEQAGEALQLSPPLV